MSGLPRGTVTLLFTDIEGSTRLLRQLGEGYPGVLAAHNRVVRAACSKHRGHEIGIEGDSFFVAFERARDAIDAAIEIQRALAEERWPSDVSVRVRIGLHTGEPLLEGSHYIGLGVHRAARISAAGHGGQILLSNATHELLEDDAPAGMSFVDLGLRRLKDFDRPERLFQVIAPGLRRKFPPVRATAAASGPDARVRVAAGIAAAALLAIATVVALAVTRRGPTTTAAAATTVRADAVGVIDPTRGTLKAELPTGPSPSRVVAARGGEVWVSNGDGRSVSRIDPATRTVRQTVAVGGDPAGIALADGAVWVANSADGTVSRISRETNVVVQRIRVGSDPTSVAATGHTVWVANSGEHTVWAIDAIRGSVVARVDVGANPSDLALGDHALWVSSADARSVSQIDLRTGRVVQVIGIGGGASAVAVGDADIWVANGIDNTVSRIDAESGRVVATIPVGNGPRAIAIERRAVWVTEQFGGAVARIDPSSNRVVERFKVGNRPTGLAIVDGDLWVGVRASGRSHRGGTLNVLGARDVDHLDPALTYDVLTVPMVGMTNDGLTAFAQVGGSDGDQVVPDLAVSLPVPTDDSRVYRFVLRPGIRFSTGATLRAVDVRASFERMFESPGSPGHEFFRTIAGASACTRTPRECDLSPGILVGPGPVVTFRLTRPDPEFLDKLALSSANILPAGTPPARDYRVVPATGPYMIAEYRRGHSLRLVRNPYFREWSQAAQPDGYPDAIVYRLNVNRGKAVDAVLAGHADVFGGVRDVVPSNRISELLLRYAGQTKISAEPSITAMFLNTRMAPFDDVRVRRALNYAVDRRAVVRVSGGSVSAVATCQILPRNFPGYVPYCPYHAPQLARARQLIRASGTTGMRVVVWTDPTSGDQARYARGLLRRLGYRATVRRPSVLYFPTSRRPRRGAQIGTFYWIADYPAPSNFLTKLMSCASFSRDPVQNLNPSQFCRPRIDAEMRRAEDLQTSDPQRAARLWARIDHEVVNAAPWLPLTNPRSVEVVSTRVGDYQFNPQLGSLLDQLWVR